MFAVKETSFYSQWKLLH